MESEPKKFCNFCQETLPLSLFKRQFKKSPSGERKPKGYSSRCKPCLHRLDKGRLKSERAPRVALRLQERRTREEQESVRKAAREQRLALVYGQKGKKGCFYCQLLFPRTDEFFIRTPGGSLSRACKNCEALKGLASEGRFRSEVRRIVAAQDKAALHLLQESCARLLAQKPEDIFLLAAVRGLALLEAQNFCCALCLLPLPNPRIDHCHKSGRARGLLCNACNMGLGWFKDNPEALKRAVAYLTQGEV